MEVNYEIYRQEIRAAQIAYFQINADILGEVKSKSYTLSEI